MDIVHLDVKGDNIMLDAKTNQPILMDMGASKGTGLVTKGGFIDGLMPPEAMVTDYNAPVSSKYDSFEVGKLLFPLMEKMGRVWEGIPQSPELPDAHYQFAPCLDPTDATFHLGTWHTASEKRVETDSNGHTEDVWVTGATLAQEALKKQFSADANRKIKLIDEQDQPRETLMPRDPNSPQHQTPGEYGVASVYVDFMNRLTSNLPEHRMTPSEALTHPFMTDALSSNVDLSKVFS